MSVRLMHMAKCHALAIAQNLFLIDVTKFKENLALCNTMNNQPVMVVAINVV